MVIALMVIVIAILYNVMVISQRHYMVGRNYTKPVPHFVIDYKPKHVIMSQTAIPSPGLAIK